MTRVRLPVSLFMSVWTTAALFWFLGALTTSQPTGQTVPVVPAIQIGKFIPETSDPPRPPRRPPPIKTPKPTDDAAIAIRDPRIVTPLADPFVPGPPDSFGPRELRDPPGEGPEITHRGGSDRGPVPQIRIEPDYPPQARDRRIEGWVTFRFTVTKEGRVRDIEIVDSQPPRIWDSATIRAVSTWKYQPALEDGVPVEQVGLMATYRFELEQR